MEPVEPTRDTTLYLEGWSLFEAVTPAAHIAIFFRVVFLLPGCRQRQQFHHLVFSSHPAVDSYIQGYEHALGGAVMKGLHPCGVLLVEKERDHPAHKVHGAS